MRIYLDYNATAPPAPGVIDRVTRALQEDFGNASSIHAFGQRAKAVVDDARSALARLIGAEPSEIVFTSGGTEADNLAIRGAAAACGETGQIITSGIEHEAVLMTCRALAAEGWQVTELPVGRNGVLSSEALEEALTPNTRLVSVMHANNEVGTIQPVAELASLARRHGARFHTDAVQSAGKIPVDVRALGVDLLSLSAHKLGGPKGVGALWIRRGVRLVAIETGGRQERNRRAGTENVPALAGLGAAAEYAWRTLADSGPRQAELRDRLESLILSSVDRTSVNGAGAERVPNTTNISFDGLEAESLLIALDLEGVAVSTGSACSSGSLEPSHVLQAMGASNARARNSLRFSLGHATTADEIETVGALLPDLVAKLRQLGRTAAALR